MPGELTTEQRAFLEKFLRKGSGFMDAVINKIPNMMTESAYRDYLEAAERYRTTAATIPDDHPEKVKAEEAARKAEAEKEKGNFTDASSALDTQRDLLARFGEGLKARRATLIRDATAVKDPKGASTTELGRLKPFRDGIAEAMKPAIPSAAQFSAADTALKSLRETAEDVTYQTWLAAQGPVKGKLDGLKGANPKAVGKAEEILRALAVKEESGTATPEGLKAAAETRKRLTDAFVTGPLSGDTPLKLSDDQSEKFVAAFAVEPVVASQTLDVAVTARNPGLLAENVGMLADWSKKGFRTPSGTGFTKPEGGQGYAKKLATMGGHLGGDYFKDLDTYLKAGHQFEDDPFANPGDSTFDKLANSRATGMGKAMLSGTGTLDPNSPELKASFDHLRFNNAVLGNPTPELARHVGETLDVLRDPVTGPQCSGLINSMTAPTGTSAKGLVGTATGKTPGTVTATDGKVAVLSAFLTPMDQGPVGSCFTTAPCRRFREEKPVEMLTGLTQVAKEGKFTGANGVTVPAVTKLPPDSNPVLRSWEYSVASSSGTKAGSREKKRLTDNLFADPNGMQAIKGITGDTTWTVDEAKLKQALSDKVGMFYDPLSKITDSSDGSSSSGRYQITSLDEFGAPSGDPVITEVKFKEMMTKLALDALGLTATEEKGVKVKALVESPAFITAICPGKYKPWELSSGGMEKGPTEALHGGTATTTDFLGENLLGLESEEKRSKDVLAKLVETVPTGGETYLNIGTGGIHSFNALPDEPGLKALKGANATETAQKIQDTLITPGVNKANADLTLERSVALYDKMVGTRVADEKDTALKGPLEIAVNANRPTAAMKPAAVKSAYKTAMDTYNKAKAKADADKWATDESVAKTIPTSSTDPTPIPNPAYEKKLKEREDLRDKLANNEALGTLMEGIDLPRVKIADTNWGDSRTHTFFLMAPDPTTGELRLWSQAEPGGKMTPVDRKWVDTNWDQTK